MVLSLAPGGTERLVIEIVRRLRDEIPMAVCCLDEAGPWASGLQAEGIQVTALGRTSGFQPALGRAVARAAAKHDATVAHCHHYSPFVYGAIARMWRPGTRVIFTEHGRLSDAPPSPRRRLANRALARVPSGVFTVSHDLREHIVDEGFAADDVRVIYNGIALGPAPDAALRDAVRAELGASPGTLVVGTVARLDPVKDLGTLIRAVADVSSGSPILLLVVGEGPERRRLEEAAAASGVPSQVRFLGHREDARRWLAGCDLYVNSSISEGVSLTILEAMAAALPIVATAVGGTPEIVDGASGRLVPARDARSLARAIRELADAPDERARMGRAARRRAEACFTIERMVDEYRRVYCEVA